MSNFTSKAISKYTTGIDRVRMASVSMFLIDNMRVKTVVLDMNEVDAMKTNFKFKQYDYGTCFISAQLMDDDKPMDLSSHKVLGIFRDSSGKIVVDESQNVATTEAMVMLESDGVVKLPIPKEVLKGYGDIDCEIVVFDSYDNRMTSPLFSFYIEKSIYNHDTEIPSNITPICGEVLCGEAICGGTADTLSEDIAYNSFLSDDFKNRFGGN